MKRKTRSNLIMVLLIAVMMVAGIIGAYFSMGDGGGLQLGTLFSGSALADETGAHTCTMTIRCDAVLTNKDKLNPAKIPYIPEDGMILAQMTVAFTPGETVFDVLQRVCDKGDIQLEYSWTPIYDSYYVEGVNHLYEFDCGPESGWMYKVNGVYPNYGCSSYTLQGGEEIVWCYTCEGLGTDVGAERMN
jgi:hypothetical protein